MYLNFTADEGAFRLEVRQFDAESMPTRFAELTRSGQHFCKADQEERQAILAKRAWLAPLGRSDGAAPFGRRQRCILSTSGRRFADAARANSFSSRMLDSVLLKYGAKFQERRMIDGWNSRSQGYLEPAALKTGAIRNGGDGDYHRARYVALRGTA